MERLGQLLEQNLIGIILAIIGLVAAYVFYRRSLLRSKLAFISESIQITGRDSRFTPDLKILFRDKEVERVTKSVFIVWNYGNTTIDGDRIVTTDPLRIRLLSSSEILDAYIASVTREVNGFSIQLSSERSNELICCFDFLDPEDGVMIEILHTGNYEATMLGTVRGIPNGIKSFGTIPDTSDEVTLKFLLRINLSIFASIFGGYLILNFAWSWLESIGGTMFTIGILALFYEVGWLLWRTFRWATRKPAPPKSLLKKFGSEWFFNITPNNSFNRTRN